MKKPIAMVMTTAFVSSLIFTPSAFANNGDIPVTPIQQGEKEEVQQKFVEVSGKIKEISEETSGNYYATINDDQEPFGFYFDRKTRIFDNTGKEVQLEEGMEITAYIDGSKPTILIYPPRYAPDVVIVKTEEGSTVQLDQFDQNYLNKKGDLIIHIGGETSITNLSGTSLTAEDVIEKDVLIFYDVVLESFPMQTGPSKIIVLETDEQANIEKAKKIVENDFYEVNGVKMIPLRLVAEQLGYEVTSTGNGAIVSNGAVSFTITRETTTYGYNKAIRQFEEAPTLLEPTKTYVPYSLLEELIAGHGDGFIVPNSK